MRKADKKYVVLLSTTGSVEEAERISDYLITNHLAACVNIIPTMRSVYWWDNKVNHDAEVLMIIKTHTSLIPEVEQSVRRLHSYQTPELIALSLQYGIAEYLQWMSESLSPVNESSVDQ
jgi:periplasmic divalent cation tolerance protein